MTKRTRTWDEQRAQWETPNRGGSITRDNAGPPSPPARYHGDGGDDGDGDDEPEIEGFELRVGDVIRCRLYRGIPGLPRFCAQGDDDVFTIGRIERTRLDGNQRYHITLIMWAVELREVVYVGENDTVNLVSRAADVVGLMLNEHEGRSVVRATATVLPAPKMLPASGKRLTP